jgi:hypothetical protein
MCVIENNLGALVEDASTERIRASRSYHAAIVHSASAGDCHVLEHDNHVRPGDVKHPVHDGLANGRAAALTCKNVSLDPGREVTDVEVARDSSSFVDACRIGSRQRISCTRRKVDDFCCAGCGILVGCNNISPQTVGRTIGHKRIGIEDCRNNPIAQFLHQELRRYLLPADGTEDLPENSFPAQVGALHDVLSVLKVV